MHHRIYNGVKRHTTTAIIALVVSMLGGAGGAIAAQQINFSQIRGKVGGAQIKRGAISEEQLSHQLLHFVEVCRDDCASNTALNGLQSRWNNDIAAAKAAILKQIEAEFVHK